jgi:hypothetical protein
MAQKTLSFGGITFMFQDCVRIFTRCDFFLWGYIKDRVFVPPLANTLVDLHARITAAITEIDPTCYREFGKNLITSLMCAMLRVERILNICNASEKNFVSFAFHQY